MVHHLHIYPDYVGKFTFAFGFQYHIYYSHIFYMFD